MHQKPYLRFSSQDYDPNQIKNKFIHLTNASINVHDPKSKDKTTGKYKIKKNMWYHTDFAEYLANECLIDDGVTDPFSQKIMP